MTAFVYPDPEALVFDFGGSPAQVYPDPEALVFDFSVEEGGPPGTTQTGTIEPLRPVNFGTLHITTGGQILALRPVHFGRPLSPTTTRGGILALRPVHFGHPVGIHFRPSQRPRVGMIYRLRPVRFGTPT